MDDPTDRVIARDAKMAVHMRVVECSDGSKQDKIVVVHPGAVVVLALTADDQILFIQNHRVTLGRTLLELPAGTREPPEPYAECAHRELFEETGYRAETLTELCAFQAAPGFSTERMVAYVARDLTFVGQQLAPDEDIVVVPIPRQEAFERLRDGGLEDGKTLAVLGSFFAKNPL